MMIRIFTDQLHEIEEILGMKSIVLSMQSLFSQGLGMFLPVELTAVFADVLRQA